MVEEGDSKEGALLMEAVEEELWEAATEAEAVPVREPVVVLLAVALVALRSLCLFEWRATRLHGEHATSLQCQSLSQRGRRVAVEATASHPLLPVVLQLGHTGSRGAALLEACCSSSRMQVWLCPAGAVPAPVSLLLLLLVIWPAVCTAR